MSGQVAKHCPSVPISNIVERNLSIVSEYNSSKYSRGLGATQATKICSPRCGKQLIGYSFQSAIIVHRFTPHALRYCPECKDAW